MVFVLTTLQHSLYAIAIRKHHPLGGSCVLYLGNRIVKYILSLIGVVEIEHTSSSVDLHGKWTAVNSGVIPFVRLFELLKSAGMIVRGVEAYGSQDYL